MAPASSKEFLDIQATVECGFTLKLVRDMIKTYNQMHRTDKYSQHSSIIWPVWLNCWVFVYELSGCGFESRCSHLKFPSFLDSNPAGKYLFKVNHNVQHLLKVSWTYLFLKTKFRTLMFLLLTFKRYLLTGN